MKSDKVCVIIVLFKPVNRNYSVLLGKTGIEVILVDNTPGCDANLSQDNVYYIPLLENKGIAYAQNIGVKKAIELGATHVVFFDQDSIIREDYVDNILSEYVRIKRLCPNMVIVGPTLMNQSNEQPYKSYKSHLDGRDHFKIVPALISSGSIVGLSDFLKVGFLEADLFIDYVDFEWCWRAESKGYVCCMTQNVNMLHKVGKKDFSFCGYPIIISSTNRYYYQYRNYIRLMKRCYVPFSWKISSLIRKIAELFLVPLYVDRKIEFWKNALRGIKDGIMGA